jgi:hypothetical protein
MYATTAFQLRDRIWSIFDMTAGPRIASMAKMPHNAFVQAKEPLNVNLL